MIWWDIDIFFMVTNAFNSSQILGIFLYFLSHIYKASKHWLVMSLLTLLPTSVRTLHYSIYWMIGKLECILDHSTDGDPSSLWHLFGIAWQLHLRSSSSIHVGLSSPSPKTKIILIHHYQDQVLAAQTPSPQNRSWPIWLLWILLDLGHPVFRCNIPQAPESFERLKRTW